MCMYFSILKSLIWLFSGLLCAYCCYCHWLRLLPSIRCQQKSCQMLLTPSQKIVLKNEEKEWAESGLEPVPLILDSLQSRDLTNKQPLPTTALLCFLHALSDKPQGFLLKKKKPKLNPTLTLILMLLFTCS